MESLKLARWTLDAAQVLITTERLKSVCPFSVRYAGSDFRTTVGLSLEIVQGPIASVNIVFSDIFL
jgi:hypothetical protein